MGKRGNNRLNLGLCRVSNAKHYFFNLIPRLIGTGHYTYKIKTKKKNEVDSYEVMRRYSEFDELQKLLAKRHPGIICPFLPRKDIRNKILDKDS